MPGQVNARSRIVHAAAWSIVGGFGLRELWQGRYRIEGDAISYLDIGDAFARGDWAGAVNAYWSPLYAWMQGLAIRVASPSPHSEFAVIAVVNFLVFAAALAAFSFFLISLRQFRQRRDDAAGAAGGDAITFPDWAWFALGYSIFAWATLHLSAIWFVTPDVALAACVYLCAGLLLRIRGRDTRWTVVLALGASLGIAYLVKAPMFVLAPVFLASAALAIGRVRTAVSRVAAAALVFAVIVGPFVAAISREKGRFTFGESGRLNMAWTVNDVYRGFWQGGPPQSGMPVHPARKVHVLPDVFEFSRPIRVTYPWWHDPSYWFEGVTPYFDLQGLRQPLTESRQLYVAWFVSNGCSWPALACCLWLPSGLAAFAGGGVTSSRCGACGFRPAPDWDCSPSPAPKDGTSRHSS